MAILQYYRAVTRIQEILECDIYDRVGFYYMSMYYPNTGYLVTHAHTHTYTHLTIYSMFLTRLTGLMNRGDHTTKYCCGKLEKHLKGLKKLNNLIRFGNINVY